MRIKNSFLLALLLIMVLAVGCSDKTVRIYTANTPVYQSTEEWRTQPITLQAPKTLVNPGRIYVYGKLLIVNEFMRGVHIFDNSSPVAPVNLGFLPVVANADIAVRNDILYLDSYTDILAFNIADPAHPVLVSRAEGALEITKFDDMIYLEGYDPAYMMGPIDMQRGVVVGWKIGEVKDEDGKEGVVNFAMSPLSNFSGGTGIGKTGNLASEGIAASTARFAVQDHYMYVLNNWSLAVFDIASGITSYGKIDLSQAGFPETVFAAEGKLFIGTTTGMLIFSLSNPTSPTYLSQYDHGNSCDPVVVQGDKAFVTLASGRNCPGDANVLDVIDISNIYQPTLLHSYTMVNPHGLGVDNDVLFVCDGSAGLKVYDKADLATIDQHMIEQFAGLTANDVIPLGNTLLMTSAAGIYQYDYSDLRNIRELSLIPVQR